jgi:hypothetical protein
VAEFGFYRVGVERCFHKVDQNGAGIEAQLFTARLIAGIHSIIASLTI